MKKTALVLLFLSLTALTFAQTQVKAQWTEVLSNSPATFQTQLVSSTENSVKVNVQVPGYYTTPVATPRGEAYIVSVPRTVSTAQAGEPDLPMIGIPVMIGDRAQMKVRVIDAQYSDFEGIEVAPSKGDFKRQIDPATVPYSYGECYSQDAFFPALSIGLYEPYILRDFRGQNIVVHPFAYNPVSKTLRVYYNMTVELYKVSDQGENILETHRGNDFKLDPDFQCVYEHHFINYEASMAKYTPISENGDLLIICYNNFMSAMTDFVNWKKTRGINTTLVSTSTTGSTYSAIKNYIQSQYNANNNLTHVLLVGDAAQIPGYPYTAGGTGSTGYDGKSDNIYGQVVGNDIYNDIIIGRFSAQNTAQVATQVQRTITYERDLTTSATWLKKGEGIAAYAGNSGHYGEDDYEHVNNIRADLQGYGYSTVYQDYENVSGYSCSASTISSHFNGGVGIGNYTNHGDVQMWAVASYSNVQVNALTNENKLPFIFSVACLVGKYDNTETYYGSGYTVGQSNDCFAEAWMHATNSAKTQPTGAIGGMFSYISQPWQPPMYGHDEMIDILVESYSSNIKRTLGGVGINGNMKILDQYGTSSNPGKGTYQAWILYGDPSLMLRTNTPQAMTVNHEGIINAAQTTYTVSVSNGNGALATITDEDHNIIGKATVNNGTAEISITQELSDIDELTLCVFGYNKVTYLGTIQVVYGEQYTINVEAEPSDGGIVAGGGEYYVNTECTLTATANRGFAFANWKLDGEVVSTDPDYTFTVTGNATYTACFMALTAHSVVAIPVEHGSVSSSLDNAYAGETVTLTATAETGYVRWSWLVYNADDISTTIPVSGNQFVMPDFDVCIAALFVVPSGGEVTIGSGNSSISYLPTWACYNYGLTQQIYTAEELGTPGAITAIAFKNSVNTSERSFDIYMKHTTKAEFSSNTDWEIMSASDKVFSGTVSYPASGWFTIDLDTPFVYDGSSNLVICVDDNTNTHITSVSSAPKCFTYSTGSNRSLRVFNYNIDFDPTSASDLSTYSGNLLTSNNQIQVTMASTDVAATINTIPEMLEGFNYDFGEGPSAPQAITLFAFTTEDLTVTATVHYEVSTTEQGSYGATLTIPSAPVLSATVYVRLKAGLDAGTYDGELLQFQSGETVKTLSLNGEVIQTNHYVFDETPYSLNMSVLAVIQIEGVEQSSSTLEIGAFCGEECRGTERPMYCPPVNRYILPLIVFGNNGDPISFKLYDDETQIELTTTTTLTFNHNGYGTISNPVILNFTTTPIAQEEQTFHFDAGWNWFSFHLDCSEELMATLLEAIAATNSTAEIKDMSFSTMLQNGTWSNSGLTFENESMYMVNLSNSVSVTLSNTPASSATHPITIQPGWNWIGFVSSTMMTIQEVFSGINPHNGDQIKNMSQASSFNGESWAGTLQQLLPGEGYMYFNNSSETMTLTFPSEAK